VAAILPNMPEAIVSVLATASIGAVWSSCSPDFGAQGALDRFGQCIAGSGCAHSRIVEWM
jgi:acetoacetyl-CoA synthetase